MADCQTIENLLTELSNKINALETANNNRIDTLERAVNVLSSAVGALRSLVDSYGAAISRISQAIANLINSFANQNKPKDGKPGAPGKDGRPGKDGAPGKDADNSGVFALIFALQAQIAALFAAIRALAFKPGIPGRNGRDGKEGRRGEKGSKGNEGDEGEKGERGEKGKQGEKGERGEKGNDGKEGKRGEKGNDGEKGEIGEKGSNGNTGNSGRNGRDGQNGKQGEVGEVQIVKVPTITEKIIRVEIPTITERIKEIKTTETITKAQDLSEVLRKIAELRSKLIYNSNVEILENCDTKQIKNTVDLPNFLNEIENKLTGIELLICKKEEVEEYNLGTFSSSKTVNLEDKTRFVKLEVIDYPDYLGKEFSRSLGEPNRFYLGSISFGSDLGLIAEQDWTYENSFYYPDTEIKPTKFYVFAKFQGINYKLTGYKVKP